MLSALLTECLASSLLAVIHHFIRKHQGNAPPEWLALSSEERQAFWIWLQNTPPCLSHEK